MAAETISFDEAVADFETVETKETPQPSFLEQSDNFSDALKDEKKEEEVIKDEIDDILDNPEEQKEEIKENKYEFLNKLVEDGSLFLFDDKQDLKEYTEEEIVDLLKANDEHKIKTAVETEIDGFYKALPEELQYAAKYIADGGKDIKGLLKALSHTTEIKELSIEEDSEDIVREYYRALEWTEEDIDDKISTLSEAGAEFVKKEASKVKPKLDKMQEEVIESQLIRQQKTKELQVKETENYINNATEVIQKGVLGNVKLDKKTQISLYGGITNPSYTTRRGTPTNELGYLLEKYQYVEPNFEKVYKALWLLKDEEAFFETFGREIKNKETEKIVRTLKTEQSKKDATTIVERQSPAVVKKSTIKRNDRPFLSGL